MQRAGAQRAEGAAAEIVRDDECERALAVVEADALPARELIAAGDGIEFAPIEVDIAGDLATWRAAIPGKVEARAEALTGPTTIVGLLVSNRCRSGAGRGPKFIAESNLRLALRARER